MNNIKQLKEQQKDAHPGFAPYLECMTRSLFSGLATFGLIASGSYFGQKLFSKALPYSAKGYILVSSCIAIVASYKVTSLKTKECQAAWMAAEDKYTYLIEIEKKKIK